MAHWAQIDENNKVIQVTIGSNEDLDEGYQWLVDNLGGRWLKTSYNTLNGKHLLNGTPFRGNFAGIGFIYDEITDAFYPPKEFASWITDTTNYTWKPPVPRPDSGMWEWNEETVSWKEVEIA